MKHKPCLTVRTIPKSNAEIVKRGKIDTPNRQIHGRALSWFGTGTLIKSGGIKLVVWGQSGDKQPKPNLTKAIPK